MANANILHACAIYFLPIMCSIHHNCALSITKRIGFCGPLSSFMLLHGICFFTFMKWSSNRLMNRWPCVHGLWRPLTDWYLGVERLEILCFVGIFDYLNVTQGCRLDAWRGLFFLCMYLNGVYIDMPSGYNTESVKHSRMFLIQIDQVFFEHMLTFNWLDNEKVPKIVSWGYGKYILTLITPAFIYL